MQSLEHPSVVVKSPAVHPVKGELYALVQASENPLIGWISPRVIALAG